MKVKYLIPLSFSVCLLSLNATAEDGASPATTYDRDSHRIKLDLSPGKLVIRPAELKLEAGARQQNGEYGGRLSIKGGIKAGVGGRDDEYYLNKFEALTLDAQLEWTADRQDEIGRVGETGRDHLKVGGIGLVRYSEAKMNGPDHSPSRTFGAQLVRGGYERDRQPVLDRKVDAATIDAVNLGVHKAFVVNDRAKMNICFDLAPGAKVGDINVGRAHSTGAFTLSAGMCLGGQIPKVGELRETARMQFDRVGAGHGMNANVISVSNRLELKDIGGSGAFIAYTYERDQVNNRESYTVKNAEGDTSDRLRDAGSTVNKAHFLTAGWAY